MPEQLNSEHLATVIPIHAMPDREGMRKVERIGGIKLNLGAMSLDELVTLEGHCTERLEDARTDRMIVQDHIATREVGDDGGAA